ncbi:hypothetical protein MPLDJ20_270097 [Mesorhizobium plurifarium]|uniref:Uncharacterized protein n=1 Tax=Mesorhizobium plurifarium TaxID=69974 RepID=A0A090FF77_MESPL|nr:hypothetical protein MPLDJ20_270097 [Mesorhizobium plurifarium]
MALAPTCSSPLGERSDCPELPSQFGAIRVRVCRSAVDLLVDLVEHLGTVGAQIGEIAAGQVLDFGDETVVVAALGDAGAGAGDKIVEHDRVPLRPNCFGYAALARPVVPP